MCYNYKILVPVVLLTLLSQISAEPQQNLDPRVSNGYPCDTTTVPYYVILVHRSLCGGSLITYSWVITAAHCLIPSVFVDVVATVHSGHGMPPELRQVRKVKEVHSHPNYDQVPFFNLTDLRYDIGLVLVDEPFHETAATRVVTLPAPGFTKQCNRVMVAGLGLTFDKEIWKTTVEERPLLCANLSIIDINTCRKNYSTVPYFDTKRTICTYGLLGKEGICKGDSGGPLICDNVLIGIISFTGSCAPRTRPDCFARVESYLDFIDHVMEFTGISIKHARTNGTSVGGQKPDKSPANSVQGRVPNWKLLLFTFLYFLYR